MFGVVCRFFLCCSKTMAFLFLFFFTKYKIYLQCIFFVGFVGIPDDRTSFFKEKI